MAIVTNGGGAGVMCADEVARHGLQLAEFPPELYAALDQLLPPFWSRHNPLDMVASAGGDVGPQVLRAVAECDAVDAVIVLSVPGRAHQRPAATASSAPTASSPVSAPGRRAS